VEPGGQQGENIAAACQWEQREIAESFLFVSVSPSKHVYCRAETSQPDKVWGHHHLIHCVISGIHHSAFLSKGTRNTGVCPNLFSVLEKLFSKADIVFQSWKNSTIGSETGEKLTCSRFHGSIKKGHV
jgi:hypothetical protein